MDARSLLTPFNVFTARPIDNINGLVGWWTFDDGTATDWSGNQNNVGSPTSIKPYSVGGIIGNALSFPGGTISVNPLWTDISSSNLVNLGNSGSVTQMCWVYPFSVTNNSGNIANLFSKGQRSVAFNYGMGISSGGYLGFANSNNLYISSAVAVVVNLWQHLAIVTTSAGSTMLINGVVIGTNASGVTTSTVNSAIGIGAPYAANGADIGFYGLIDDIRVYNRALATGEINAIYNQALAYQQGQPEGELPALYLASTTFPFLINPLITTQEQPVLHPFPMVATRSVQGPNVGTPEFRKLITSQEQAEYYYTSPITRAGVYTGFNPVWAIKSNIIFPGPAGT